MNQLINTNSQMLCKRTFAAGASSQCYWDELILSKCELMLLKCQINTNTNKNGILLSAKWLERVLKYSYLDSIILKNLFMFVSFLTILCWSDITLTVHWEDAPTVLWTREVFSGKIQSVLLYLMYLLRAPYRRQALL